MGRVCSIFQKMKDSTKLKTANTTKATGITSTNLLLAIAVMFVPGFADRAHSATNTVTSLADRGVGSLRRTMADSAAGDSIVFGVAGTITLTSGELVVTKNLAIFGPGVYPLVISGNNSVRVFYVNTNVHLSLANLTIANGFGDKGAGVYNSGGELILHHCTLINNFATGQAGAPYSGQPRNQWLRWRSV